MTKPPLRVAEISDEELARKWPEAQIAQRWSNAVQRETKKRLEKGAQLPHLSLQPTQGNRQWGDEDLARDALTGAGVKPELCGSLPSPAQMEQRLRDSDGVLDPALEELIDALTYRPDALSVRWDAPSEATISDT